jgi:hypothetical protein
MSEEVKRLTGLLKPINLRSENKIAFSQPVNLVCPNGNFSPTPPITNVGMMPLFFSQFTDSIYKRLSLLKVLELVFLAEVVPIHNFPTIQLGLQLRYLVSW